MCRNITTLRGLQPGATSEEIEAAARQYVRKISGVQSTSAATGAAFERAVARVATATTDLLAELPPRKTPPPTLPPLRRLGRTASSRGSADAPPPGLPREDPAACRPVDVSRISPRR